VRPAGAIDPKRAVLASVALQRRDCPRKARPTLRPYAMRGSRSKGKSWRANPEMANIHAATAAKP